MDAARVSGLFVPLTGEALVDAGTPASLLPFTAVHELTHLAGIADEGAANIEAWRRCMAAGGAFADSARLWTLRYAMGMLARADAPAHLRMSAKMKDPLSQVFDQVNGEAETRNGYGAVVAALCVDSAYQAPNARLFRFPSAPLRASLAPTAAAAHLAGADHAAKGEAQRGGDGGDQRDIPNIHSVTPTAFRSIVPAARRSRPRRTAKAPRPGPSGGPARAGWRRWRPRRACTAG